MPSDKHTKIKERQLRADRIEKNGIPMQSPCSNCSRNKRSCVVASGLRCCSECARRNSRCDVSGPSVEQWAKLQREEERLRAEARITREAVATAMARLNRLEQQQALLKSRGDEMLRRGLSSLDELEETEERERQEAEKRPLFPTPSSEPAAPSSAPDPYADFDFAAFSPAY